MTDAPNSPQAEPQPTEGATAPAAEYPAAQEPPKKSRAGLIVLIAIGAVLLIGAVIAGIVFAINLASTLGSNQGVQPGSEEDTVSYVSEEYGYSVEFPGEPIEDTQTQSVAGAEISLTQAQWIEGDRMYISVAADLSEFLVGQDPDDVLENSIAGAAGNTGATAVGHEFLEVDGERALSAQLDLPNGQSLFWLVVVRDGIQYQLGAPADKADHDWFVESFDFTD